MSAGLCVLDHNKAKADFEGGDVLDLFLQQIILLSIFVILPSESYDCC